MRAGKGKASGGKKPLGKQASVRPKAPRPKTISVKPKQVSLGAVKTMKVPKLKGLG